MIGKRRIGEARKVKPEGKTGGELEGQLTEACQRMDELEETEVHDIAELREQVARLRLITDR